MGGEQPAWQQVAPEEDVGSNTSSRRNMLKWECDEDLGENATISAVLYCNLRHPELKQQYPGKYDKVQSWVLFTVLQRNCWQSCMLSYFALQIGQRE